MRGLAPTSVTDPDPRETMAPPLLTLQSITLTHGGHPLLDGAELFVSRGSGSASSAATARASRPCSRSPPAMRSSTRASASCSPTPLPLSAAGTGPLGLATTLAYVEAGLGPLDNPYRALSLLNDLGLSGEEDPTTLSGGEARRAAIARVLAPEPDILLLDEPTNHLDLPAIEWLESELARACARPSCSSATTGGFSSNLSRATVWLDRGRTRRLDQGFAGFEGWRDQVLEEEERDRHKLDRKIAMEEDWVRYGVTARRKRNVRRMGDLASLRQTRREERRGAGTVKISVSEGRHLGQARPSRPKGISKSYGERPIVTDFFDPHPAR